MLGASLTAILLSYEDLDRGDVPHLPGLRALYLLCADVDVLHKEGPVAQSPRDYFCHVDRPADRHAPCLYVDLSHLRELDERRHRVAHHWLFSLRRCGSTAPSRPWLELPRMEFPC